MPGTIFISHRAEYASLVRELKKAIERPRRPDKSTSSFPKTSRAPRTGEKPSNRNCSVRSIFFSFTARLMKTGPGASTRLATSPALTPVRNISVPLIVLPGPRWILRAP
jgi:hypothetical protein